MRAREKLPAVMAHVTIEEPEDSGTAAIRNLLKSVQSGKVGEAVGKNLLPMLRGMGDVARLVWYSKMKQRRAVSERAVVRLTMDVEQPAKAETRICLAESKDALGLRKARVEWTVGAEERDAVKRYVPVIRAELERLGMGPAGWSEAVEAGEFAFADTFHPMGGLRMGNDARTSVVDTDLRVHGMGNLYVASCAVYPVGGEFEPYVYVDGACVEVGGPVGAGLVPTQTKVPVYRSRLQRSAWICACVPGLRPAGIGGPSARRHWIDNGRELWLHLLGEGCANLG